MWTVLVRQAETGRTVRVPLAERWAVCCDDQGINMAVPQSAQCRKSARFSMMRGCDVVLGHAPAQVPRSLSSSLRLLRGPVAEGVEEATDLIDVEVNTPYRRK